MTFARVDEVDTLTAKWCDASGAHALPMSLGPMGRAAVETALLKAVLNRLRPTKAA